MRKRAFTLIELLVVIAIIAILAAILFPVFAQAKAAAKKAASISNNKQNALATIMYSGDYDDVNPVYISWIDNAAGAPAYLGTQGLMPWSWNVQPYMKNVDILQDPQAPPIKDWPAAWGTTIPKGLSPIYGYNYTFLSAPYGAANNPTYQPISTTAVAEPANTVLTSAKWSTGEWNFGATTVVWYGSPRGLIINYAVDSPDCYTIPQWCFGNWGSGDGNMIFTLGDNNKINAGVRTGGNSIRSGNGCVVAWCDGHVSVKQPGALGAGTNWNMNLPAGSLVVNDRPKYLWDTL